MQGILTVAANNDKQKNKSFSSDGPQFSCMLKLTVNLKSVHLSCFGTGLQKILSQLGVELQRQAENDKVEQFGHYMWKWMSYFHCFTGPFPWTCWEEGRVGHFFSHKISKHTNFKNLCILSLPTHHKFSCDSISLLLWLFKHQVWHLSHYYLKFTLKYWNFWKHCF